MRKAKVSILANDSDRDYVLEELRKADAGILSRDEETEYFGEAGTYDHLMPPKRGR